MKYTEPQLIELMKRMIAIYLEGYAEEITRKLIIKIYIKYL